MAGVFELIKGSQRRLVGGHGVLQRPNHRALELQAAKEILAEVFGIRISDVKEMIQNRFEASRSKDVGLKEDGLWPREFWLEEWLLTSGTATISYSSVFDINLFKKGCSELC